MKALVGAFNQEKALVGAFSVIVKTGCGADGSIYSTTSDTLFDWSLLQPSAKHKIYWWWMVRMEWKLDSS